MAYVMEFRPRALREFKKLPRDVKVRLKPHIDTLADNPRAHGVEKLSGLQDYYRIRVGDYRIVYRILDDVLVIYIVGDWSCFGTRSQRYRATSEKRSSLR